MIETKKVAILNGETINIFHSDEELSTFEITADIQIEEHEMKYSIEHGWREVEWSPPITQEEKIIELEKSKNNLENTIDFILTEIIPNLSGGI